MGTRSTKLAAMGPLCLAAIPTLCNQAHAQQTQSAEKAMTPSPSAASGELRPASLAVPPPEVLLMLVRTSLVALNQANFTGNYTVLHALGTPQLQASISPAQFAIAFTNLRDQKLDLSPILVLTPELTVPPSLDRKGTLRLEGVFRTTPVHLSFVIVLRPISGVWRIDGISVSTIPVPATTALRSDASAVAIPIRKKQ
jgi:hypothetical protein